MYHVVSRFVERRKVFGDEEREVFRAMMGAFAAFHQAEAMAGKAEAMEGIAWITGATAERVHGHGLGEAVPVETAAMRNAQCGFTTIGAAALVQRMEKWPSALQ